MTSATLLSRTNLQEIEGSREAENRPAQAEIARKRFWNSLLVNTSEEGTVLPRKLPYTTELNNVIIINVMLQYNKR